MSQNKGEQMSREQMLHNQFNCHSRTVYLDLRNLCLIGTTCNVLAFCLLANVYIVPICIIAEALSMFSTRECVPDICPLEYKKKYCPLGRISQYTMYLFINMIYEDHAIQYHPCCQ